MGPRIRAEESAEPGARERGPPTAVDGPSATEGEAAPVGPQSSLLDMDPERLAGLASGPRSRPTGHCRRLAPQGASAPTGAGRGRARGGRPRIDPSVRPLIVQMSKSNPTWGAPRIQAGLPSDRSSGRSISDAPDRIRTCDLMLRRALPCTDLHRNTPICAGFRPFRTDSLGVCAGSVCYRLCYRGPFAGSVASLATTTSTRFVRCKPSGDETGERRVVRHDCIHKRETRGPISMCGGENSIRARRWRTDASRGTAGP